MVYGLQNAGKVGQAWPLQRLRVRSGGPDWSRPGTVKSERKHGTDGKHHFAKRLDNFQDGLGDDIRAGKNQESEVKTATKARG